SPRGWQQVGQAGEGASACGAECGAYVGLGQRLACRAVPEARGDALETRMACEVADMLACDDQFAALAIDMAQDGLRGPDAVQTDLAFGEVHIHDRISFQP